MLHVAGGCVTPRSATLQRAADSPAERLGPRPPRRIQVLVIADVV